MDYAIVLQFGLFGTTPVKELSKEQFVF